MVRIQNIRDKNTKLSIGGKIYKIDADGYCEFPEKEANFLLSGPLWEAAAPSKKKSEVKDADEPKAKEPVPEKPVKDKRLDDLDRAGLIEVATDLGLKVDKNDSKLKIVAAIKAAKRNK